MPRIDRMRKGFRNAPMLEDGTSPENGWGEEMNPEKLQELNEAFSMFLVCLGPSAAQALREDNVREDNVDEARAEFEARLGLCAGEAYDATGESPSNGGYFLLSEIKQ